MVRPLFVSTYPPETCALAAIAKDIADAVDRAADEAVSLVIAIKKSEAYYTGDPRVVHVIDNHRLHSYTQAAEVANDGPCDVVSLQHEFGLYPDAWGGRVLEFARHCEKPIVTTLHTLMAEPELAPRRIIQTLATLSQRIVVTSEAAAELLASAYHVSGPRVQVISHEVPLLTFELDENLPPDSQRRAHRHARTMALKKLGTQYRELFDRVAGEKDSSLHPLYRGGFVKTSDKVGAHGGVR